MKFDVDQMLVNLLEARKTVQHSLDELDQRIEEIRHFKRFAVRPIEVAVYKSESAVETSSFVPTESETRQFNTDYGGVDCIAHCASMVEALYAWADAHDGEVFLPDLVAPIRAVGLTKAKDDHGLMSTLEGYCVRSRAEDWSKIGTRHYKRIYHDLSADPTPEDEETEFPTSDGPVESAEIC